MAAHPEEVRAERRAAAARYSVGHRTEINARSAALRSAFKVAVVEAYGGRCACPGCHVHHAELLTVDHVAGNGSAHRKELGTRSSRDFYGWLQRQGFPAGYQLLCGSCNLAKSNKAACPLAGVDH